jgi:hypothetical protein
VCCPAAACIAASWAAFSRVVGRFAARQMRLGVLVRPFAKVGTPGHLALRPPSIEACLQRIRGDVGAAMRGTRFAVAAEGGGCCQVACSFGDRFVLQVTLIRHDPRRPPLLRRGADAPGACGRRRWAPRQRLAALRGGHERANRSVLREVPGPNVHRALRRQGRALGRAALLSEARVCRGARHVPLALPARGPPLPPLYGN